jgi:aspartate kinase
MIVMKFGGTSVGRPAYFRLACDRIVRELVHDPVVVASALAGVTDLLAEYCRDPAQRPALDLRFREHHLEFCRAAELPPALLEPAFDDWRRKTQAMRPTPIVAAERDQVLGFGERCAVELLAGGLRARGVDAVAVHAGDAGLVTDDHFGAAHPVPEAAARIRQGLALRPPLPVVTGFLGRTADGRPTTLGRGGSDYTAALIGAALDAEEIQIWTDTSGMLSADPNVVPEARPVPHLSFAEASELAYFGAKVLHPKTLVPAMDRGIPVRVLNTGRPDDPGSLITATAEAGPDRWRVKSIAGKKGITAVTISSTRMLLAHGFLARVFEAFARQHIVVDLVTTSEVSISLTVDDTARLEQALAGLDGIGQVDVRHGLAVVAVVGEEAPTNIGLAGHVFTLLGGVGIRVEMISQGASRVNLSFVVRESEADAAVRVLHRGLGLDADMVATAETREPPRGVR